MPRSFSGRTSKARNAGESSNRKRAHSVTSSNESDSPDSPAVQHDQDNGSTDLASKKKRFSVSNAESASSPSIAGTSTSTPESGSQHNVVIQRGVPAFLNKLYNMVEDPSTDDLVRWSPDGTSFIVEKHERFAKTVLPRFYKHNTFASFVRQLNMYDFHKVPHPQQGVLLNGEEGEIWEFRHTNFIRGKPELLHLVTRKRKDRELGSPDLVTLRSLVEDLATIKKQQMAISNDLRSLKEDNVVLWQETLAAREKHQRHQEVIEKILQFLTAVFSSEYNAIAATAAQVTGPFMLGKNNEYISLLGKQQKQQQQQQGTGNGLPTALIEEAASIVGISSKSKDGTGMYPFSLGSDMSDMLSAAVELLYSIKSIRPRSTGTSGSSSSSRPHIEHPTDANQLETRGNIETFTDTLNTATRSAEAIAQEIDNLEFDIEALAANLGIDPRQFADKDFDSAERMYEFADGYSEMINSATRKDKIGLYKLAGGSHVRNEYDATTGAMTKGHPAISPIDPSLLAASSVEGTTTHVTSAPSVDAALPEATAPPPSQQPTPIPYGYPPGDPNMLGIVSSLSSVLQSYVANYLGTVSGADLNVARNHYTPDVATTTKDPTLPVEPPNNDNGSTAVPPPPGPASTGNPAIPGAVVDARILQSLYQDSSLMTSALGVAGTQQQFVAVPVPVPVPVPVHSPVGNNPSPAPVNQQPVALNPAGYADFLATHGMIPPPPPPPSSTATIPANPQENSPNQQPNNQQQ